MLKIKLTYIIKQVLYLTDRMICYQFIFSLCRICLLKQEMSQKYQYPLVQIQKGCTYTLYNELYTVATI